MKGALSMETETFEEQERDRTLVARSSKWEGERRRRRCSAHLC